MPPTSMFGGGSSFPMRSTISSFGCRTIEIARSETLSTRISAVKCLNVTVLGAGIPLAIPAVRKQNASSFARLLRWPRNSNVA